MHVVTYEATHNKYDLFKKMIQCYNRGMKTEGMQTFLVRGKTIAVNNKRSRVTRSFQLPGPEARMLVNEVVTVSP